MGNRANPGRNTHLLKKKYMNHYLIYTALDWITKTKIKQKTMTTTPQNKTAP